MRFQKMTSREDPMIYEVSQKFNLNLPDSPAYEFKKNSFSFGLGMFATRTTVNWATGSLKVDNIEIPDSEKYLQISPLQFNFDAG